MKLSFWATRLTLPAVWNLALCGGILPLKQGGLDQFGVNSWCLPRHPGAGAVKGEENTEGNLSLGLFPKHIHVPVSPERRKSHLSCKCTSWVFIFVFPGIALGRRSGLERCFRCFTGGFCSQKMQLCSSSSEMLTGGVLCGEAE